MEKIIALRISVLGDKDALNAAKAINAELKKTGQQLDAIAKQRLQLGSITSGSGGRGGTRKSEADELSTRIPQTLAQLKQQILLSKEAGLEYGKLVERAVALQKRQAAVNQELKEQAGLVKQIPAPEGPNSKIPETLAQIKQQILLSKEAGLEYDKLVAKAAALTKEQKEINDQIKKQAGLVKEVQPPKPVEGPSSIVPQTLAQIKQQIALSKEAGLATDKLVAKAAELTREQKEVNDAIRQQAGLVKQVKPPSIRQQIQEAIEAGQAYDNLVVEAGRLKDEQQRVNREISEQARLFEENREAAGSYRQINAELVRLRNTYRQLGEEERDGIAGKQTLQRIDLLDRKLKDLDSDMGIYARNVGNYSSAFSAIGGTLTRFLAIGGIAIGADEIVQATARISDSISNVEKVTGLATDRARGLAEQLKLRDTRTSLEDLLAIAEIGGRVGINVDVLGVEETERQLIAFTDAIDTANVALGDQFDNDAGKVADTLAGLRNVLTDFRPNGDADIGGDLLRIGNALNFLETQGNSTAPVIADFVNRIGGVAVPFDASTESIFALSTTLDELEVSAERGATAVSTTLAKLAAAPEKFAQVVVDAGLAESTDQFVKLVNDDIITALTLVSQAVNEGSENNSDFAQTLAALGITGARAQEVFAKLGGSADRYTELLGLSAEALSETSSLTDEFAKKNDNLAGDLEKLKNQLTQAFAGGEVQDALRVIVQTLAEFLGLVISIPKFLKENKAEVALLATALLSFNAAAIAARINTLRMAAAQKIATIQQRLLNTAFITNPVGAFIAGVLLLVTAFTALYRNSETVRGGINRFIDAIREAYGSSLALRLILGPLGLVIKIFLDVFREGTGAIDGYIDAANRLKDNVPAYLQLVILKLKEFALSAADAFNFGIGEEKIKAQLDAVAEQIRTQQSRIADNNDRYRRREIEREKARLAAETKEREGAAAEDVVVVRKSEEEKTTATKEGLAERLAAEKEAEKERARAAKQAAEEAKRRREQEAKDRLAAAQRIADLENAAIGNRFDRQEAQATTTAERDIAGLVGDPEQIEQQAALIRAALRRELAGIQTEREAAYREALESVREYSEELRRVQVENAEGEADAALQAAQRAAETQSQALAKQTAQREADLVAAFRSGEIKLKEYTERRKEIERENAVAVRELRAARLQDEATLDAQATEARLSRLKTEYELLKEERQRQAEARVAEIDALEEAGDLTGEEAAAARREAAALLREQDLEDLREFEEAKLEVAADFAERSLEREEEEIAESIARQQELNSTLQSIADQRKTIFEDSLVSIGRMTGAFLADQERDFKRFLQGIILLALDALERLILLKIAEATATALASPDSVATAGAAGIAKSAILTVLIKAAFAGVKAAVSSFETGGVIGGGGDAQDGYGANWYGGQVPMHGGVVKGLSHSAGGIRQGGVEIEKDEYLIVNGPERYVVNRASTRLFKDELDYLRRNPSIFSPMRRQQVSRINSFNGYGVRFSQGGVIGANPTPLPAPLGANGLVPFDPRGGQASGGASAEEIAALRELARGALAMAAATDARIDRLVVTMDPAEAARKGAEKLAVKARQEL